MPKRDLDDAERDRLDAFFDRSSNSDTVELDQLFRFEKVVGAVKSDKILLSSFIEDEILSIAPFTSEMFVILCPLCIKSGNFERFKSLVRTGLIIPIFGSLYNQYPSDLIDFSINYTHISHFEFFAYRHMGITSGHSNIYCPGCASKRFDAMRNKTLGRRNSADYKSQIDVISANINPYIEPDICLFDLAENANDKRQLSKLKYLANLSFVVRDFRTCEAFDAPVLLKEHELGELPRNISVELDSASDAMATMRLDAANGYGITVPKNIPIETYSEIVRDFRPEMKKIASVHEINGRYDDENQELRRSIVRVNAEIERIKNLKRFHLLQTTVRSFGRSEAMLAASLIGGAFGWIGPALSCSGAAGSAISSFLKRRNPQRITRDSRKLLKAVVRDAKPYTDSLLRLYLGTDMLSARVLSMRSIIENASEKPSEDRKIAS